MNVNVRYRMLNAHRAIADERRADSSATSGSKRRPFGFSVLELLIVIAIVLVIAGMSIPTWKSVRSYKVRNDARAILGQLMVARMRAGSDFARVQMTCTIATRDCVLSVRQNGDAEFTDEPAGGKITLSSGVSFAIPAGASTGAGGQNSSTPQQGSSYVTPTAGKIQITFNSRGLPINPANGTSVMVPDYAIYLMDNDKKSFAVAVDTGGRPILYAFDGSSYVKFKD